MMQQGLTTEEARESLRRNGYNELTSTRPKNLLLIAKEVFREPMFLLLLACGGLYIFLGDFREGIILLGAIVVIIFITFYQYRKTENALEALKKLSSPRALVIRDGTEIRIPGREVVPGDVLILNEGDRIPADALLLNSTNLTVDESLLTGESVPVIKSAGVNSEDTQGNIFSGTLVVQGKALAAVIATGAHTQFGKIGGTLQSIRQDETRLQKEMKKLIRNLFLIGIIISLLVIVAFYLARGGFLQSLLNGLAAAMAILPEEFPVVLTIFLALGAWRLSKKRVLTRNPSAIETLGSATVLCTDKTGTITQNKMEMVALYDGNELIEKKDFNHKQHQIIDLIRSAYEATGQGSVDPMEQAIVKVHRTIFPERQLDFKLVKEYPFSRKLLTMTQVIETAENQVSVSAKGAPEAIIQLCNLNTAEKATHEQAIHAMAAKGFRVIGVASAEYPGSNLPASQHEFEFKFVGLIGFEDPIRPEVPQAIKECGEAGIKVIMITGDFPVTARSIARQIGIPEEGQIITGPELQQMSNETLRRTIANTSIFARVVPEQKLRIVQALKANNEVVAMTGDGVNDAPALKAAHIGIAMGNKGTDVAREASSLVLLDDNFASIVSGLRQGRRIFDNLEKAMSYILAIHIPIIGLTLIPAFFPGIPLLLMPLHIVFMELIIDPVCSVAFETEQEEKGIMKRPPRDPNEKFFGATKILISIGKGMLLLLMVMVIYFLSLNEGHTDGEVRAITFSALIVGNIFLILSDLSKTRTFISVFQEKNHTASIILLSSVIMLVLSISVPGLQKTFNFEFPGYRHFLSSFTGAVLMLLILEALKFTKSRKFKTNNN